MRPSASKVFDITSWLERQPGVVCGSSEADLNGAECVLYTLGPRPCRYAFDLHDVMQRLQVELERGCVFYNDKHASLFRACPVFSLKQLFANHPSHRCRVVFDVDTVGQGGLVCDPELLISLFTTWLNANVEGGDFSKAAVWVWGGQFPDKAQSFHIYFPDFVWASVQSNVYKNVSFASLDAALQPFGLKVDTSITTSGIKLFQSDKWLAKQSKWRDMAQRLVFARDLEGGELDLSVILWQELFQNCLPVVAISDQRTEVSFKPPTVTTDIERAPKRHQPRVLQPMVVVAAPAASDPIGRLMLQVPLWANCPLKRVQSGAKPLCVVPVSSHCPLKTLASDDNPAFQHSTSGKCYALIGVLGDISIRCHICPNKMDIAAPPVPAGHELERLLHERFSGEWARGPPGTVIQFAQLEPFREAKKVSHNDFIKHCTRNGEKVNGVAYPKYWLQMPDAPSFPNGFGFYPDHIVPEGFYNLYTGFDAAIERASQEFANMRGEGLLAELPNWTRMIRENICASDNVLFEYLMKWMAHTIQLPQEKPAVALVLVGKAGCGKGLTLTPCRLIHGRHGMVTDEIDSRFNGYYATAVYLHLEELKKSEKAANALKILITEKTMAVEYKGVDKGIRQVCQHVVISSNDFDSVFWQAQERRFVAFPCAGRLENWGPEVQGAIGAEVEDTRRLGALLQYWRTLDLTGWNPRVLPMSPATFKIQFESLSVYEKYVYFMLKRGGILSTEFDMPGDSKDLPRIELLLQENARVHNHEARPLAEIGFRNWHTQYCKDAVPKLLFVHGFVQMFPRQSKETQVPLWKFLHELSNGKLFTVKQIRLPGPGNLRIETVSDLASLVEWRLAFQKHRGNLDDHIWTDQGVDI